MNIYDIRRTGIIVFFIVSAAVIAFFLYYSNNIIKNLAQQERARMQIWANATREIVNLENSWTDSDYDNTSGSGVDNNIDIGFLVDIIEDNRTIPVLLTDDEGNIIDHRNFDLPEPVDSMRPLFISDKNREFLLKKLQTLQHSANVIHIIIAPDNMQHLYYEDSKLLKRLSYYPYVQLVVMLAFVTIVYFAVSSSKRAEQNKVWVGLSKETAHQLGTPISSLMAWMEILPEEGVSREIVDEMQKDVNRLSTIASRFSKIGSKPKLEPTSLNDAIEHCVTYMSARISSRIKLSAQLPTISSTVELSEPLFQWVLENLIKNAVDAMPDGSGKIDITVSSTDSHAIIEVHDSGKGIPRKNFKSVFNPGVTSKKRGWGLGLTLAKRIIESYHDGKIFVKSSEPGLGTTFRIELPLA